MYFQDNLDKFIEWCESNELTNHQIIEFMEWEIEKQTDQAETFTRVLNRVYWGKQ